MTTVKPILLDLFCGAGGAARGYQLAGFEVIGVDIEPQPHIPPAYTHFIGERLMVEVMMRDRMAA